ncbi:MAG: precorrin-2 C(20)-methyltransferase [Nitrososphaeraceae archaeon]|jgi:precorrin-2/cobalt-factor-2 C20-methyltransferase|nr:precorrin-2 C(20)-methyltransferase [Thermoproteota archaeon]MDW3604645.1 precorrin-2 C(20)-methyltransferase [Nitrososphaeraceae archaeon]MDW3626107.1 precorrin-2 C(20)-methyltransferase [Nitrososphaeraceae archaeon]HJY15739.1 precorrin-2 C(20)-methyltransferase [Nitrososphaeraceae archaeon]
MKLFCVGCGPGDPELLTIRALNLITEADVIFVPTSKLDKPSIALSIVAKYIKETTKIINLVFPMVKDKDSLKDYWKKNTLEISQMVRTGKKTLYLTVGDPSLYSTWIYIHRELKKNHKDIEIEIIPGITSIFAFAAESKLSLVEGNEHLSIVPACYDLNKVKNTVKASDTIVFLKDGRYFDNVIEMLSDSGFGEETQIAIAQDVSTKENILEIKHLKDLKGKKQPSQKYFSIMVVKRNDRE